MDIKKKQGNSHLAYRLHVKS